VVLTPRSPLVIPPTCFLPLKETTFGILLWTVLEPTRLIYIEYGVDGYLVLIYQLLKDIKNVLTLVDE
jgi:hypothetical protein